MTELLPCPFCGGEAEVHAAYDIYPVEVDGYFVICRNKNCTVWPETDEYLTEAEAIAAWNTRAERTCRIEGRYGNQYCTCCGEMVGTWDSTSELYIDGNMVELWNYCPNCGAKVVSE